MGVTTRGARQRIDSPIGARIVIDGRSYSNFGGSSYLGLSSKPEIMQAGMLALRDYGAGGSIPWVHDTTTSPLEEVESEAAKFFSRPAALFLVGGYYFGLVSLAALREQFSVIFLDEWAHYSLREAIAASGLRHHTFRHVDTDDLENQLRQRLRAGDRPLIATDGLFSTFGEIPPLDDYARLVASYDGRLLIDESHSFGVIGASGRGAAEHCHLDPSIAIIGGSLGKAFGTSGGIVPAEEKQVAAFRATPVGYGASIGPPALSAMCAASLKYVREHPGLLVTLRDNVAYMKSGLRALGLDVGDSSVPIASFVTPGRSMQQLRADLMAAGIFVYHTTYIGASEGGAIRCAIFADHTREQMDGLFAALRRLL